jgi:hypothetical protein
MSSPVGRWRRDLAAGTVGAGEAAVQQRLELLGGVDAGVDVALGRVLGGPLEQMGSKILGGAWWVSSWRRWRQRSSLGWGGRARPAYSAFLGVSTETMRTGWSMTGAAPSGIRDRVRRSVRWP